MNDRDSLMVFSRTAISTTEGGRSGAIFFFFFRSTTSASPHKVGTSGRSLPLFWGITYAPKRGN